MTRFFNTSNGAQRASDSVRRWDRKRLLETAIKEARDTERLQNQYRIDRASIDRLHRLNQWLISTGFEFHSHSSRHIEKGVTELFLELTVAGKRIRVSNSFSYTDSLRYENQTAMKEELVESVGRTAAYHIFAVVLESEGATEQAAELRKHIQTRP